MLRDMHGYYSCMIDGVDVDGVVKPQVDAVQRAMPDLHSHNTPTESSCPQQYTAIVR